MERHRRTLNALVLSERGQSKKTACCMTSTTRYFEKGETKETAGRSVAAGGWELAGEC